ncbi:hypothetical protein COP1_030362 [Malus domestica]
MHAYTDRKSKMTQNNPISPNLPCKLRHCVRLLISILTTVIDAVRRSNGTVNRRLMSLFDFKALPSDKPNNAVKTPDVMVDPSRNLWFRLYVPTTTDPASKLPPVIYFHGGGFVFFSANSQPYNDLCKRLATKLPAVIISVNYRHAPEHRYPSQYEDSMDVLKFIDTTRIEGLDLNNVDITRCFLAGDSAGGNLAHHVRYSHVFGGKERTESETRLAKEGLAITLEQTDWYWKAFLPEGSNRDHAVVNVFGPESSGILGVKFPATIVFMGGFDPLQDWQKMYYQGLKKKGIQAYLIEYPNSFHGFYVFPELKESSFFIKEVKDFIDKLSTC